MTKYKVGSTVTGNVTGIEKYGAFVSLDDYYSGLIHISEISDGFVKDINDSKACALELANLLKGMNCYVNLIPYNETHNICYKRSSYDKIVEFYDILKKENLNIDIINKWPN